MCTLFVMELSIAKSDNTLNMDDSNRHEHFMQIALTQAKLSASRGEVQMELLLFEIR